MTLLLPTQRPLRYSDHDPKQFKKAIDELTRHYEALDFEGYSLNQIVNAHLNRIMESTEQVITHGGREECTIALIGLHQWIEDMIDQTERVFPGIRKAIEGGGEEVSS